MCTEDDRKHQATKDGVRRVGQTGRGRRGQSQLVIDGKDDGKLSPTSENTGVNNLLR